MSSNTADDGFDLLNLVLLPVGLGLLDQGLFAARPPDGSFGEQSLDK